jgi:5'-3' exonuclease
MTEETSPIHDFYPKEFELDMNGKKQDWEAVVKIPFIDQARLLRAMGRKSSWRFLTDNSPGRPLDRRRETKESIWSFEHSIHL